MEANMEQGKAAQKSLLESIAETMSGTANAARIYGSPIERDGTTIIPVAKASYGFGGGAGKKAGEEGSGGGGGMMLTPIGYIEMRQGKSRFRTIQDPQTWMKIIAITGLFTFLTVKSLAKLLKS